MQCMNKEEVNLFLRLFERKGRGKTHSFLLNPTVIFVIEECDNWANHSKG